MFQTTNQWIFLQLTPHFASRVQVLANLAVSEHRVCPRPKTSRLKGFPQQIRYQSRQSHEHVQGDHHDHSSFPQKCWATQDSPSHLFSSVLTTVKCHQGDHPAVFPHQAISTPAFNMSWPFCTVRVVSLAKCCNCLSTCAVFRRFFEEMGMWR